VPSESSRSRPARPLWRAYSPLVWMPTQRRDIALPRSVAKVPSSELPAIASREVPIPASARRNHRRRWTGRSPGMRLPVRRAASAGTRRPRRSCAAGTQRGAVEAEPARQHGPLAGDERLLYPDHIRGDPGHSCAPFRRAPGTARICRLHSLLLVSGAVREGGRPGRQVWRYLAFRVFPVLTANGPVNRPTSLGCVTYFVIYQL